MSNYKGHCRTIYYNTLLHKIMQQAVERCELKKAKKKI